LTKNNIKHTGVYYDSGRKRWKALISHGDKLYSLGSYDCVESAIAIRKQAEEAKAKNSFPEWREKVLEPLIADRKKTRKANGLRATNSSGYMGVAFLERINKWKAFIGYARKLYTLGCYAKLEDAVSVRKEAEKRKADNTFLDWYKEKFNKSVEAELLIKGKKLLSTGEVAKMVGMPYQVITKYAITNNKPLLNGRYYLSEYDIQRIKEACASGENGHKPHKPHKPKDITGKKNGMLTAVRLTGEKKDGLYVWIWKCGYCGREIKYTYHEVYHNNKTSCGCQKRDISSRIDFFDHTNIDRIKSTKLSKNNKSGITGVRYDEKTKKWIAVIGFKKKNYHLGTFKTKEVAVAARRNAEAVFFQTAINEFEKYIKTRKHEKKQ
jgi:hypothetical protein